MKRLFLATLLTLAPLGGCGPITSVLTGSSVASQAPSVSIAVEKSLTITHLAYNGIGQALIDATKIGALHGTNAVAAKAFYDKAGDALAVADKADDAANQEGVISAITAANDAITAANALVKGN